MYTNAKNSLTNIILIFNTGCMETAIDINVEFLLNAVISRHDAAAKSGFTGTGSLPCDSTNVLKLWTAKYSSQPNT